MGQWHAEVLSQIDDFSRQSVLPVVCSVGENVSSTLEALSNYPSWYSQRQIHVLGRNVVSTLGEVVYLGALGPKGGRGGEASASGEQRDERQTLTSSHQVRLESLKSCDSFHTAEGNTQSPIDQLKALTSDPQIDQQPDKLAELGEVLLKLAKSKQEAGASAQDLSLYTAAAILYQHVLKLLWR